jgi:methylase of polypeptide subunit release factors
MAHSLYEQDIAPINSALEVGSGSGLLSASLVQHLRPLQEMTCLDIDSASIICTDKNVVKIATANARPGFPKIRLSIDAFNANTTRPSDFVVCNPPYIPTPPAGIVSDSAYDKLRAVGGTTLLTNLIKNAPSILNPNGRLLLMISSLCKDIAQNEIAKLQSQFGDIAYYNSCPDGFEVSFDVEAVFNRESWLKHLRSQKGLLERKEGFFHKLYPIWIVRRGI